MSQAFTFIDIAGNQAQYTISEKDYRPVVRGSSTPGQNSIEGQHGGKPAIRRSHSDE
jgi:hypothetical protein